MSRRALVSEDKARKHTALAMIVAKRKGAQQGGVLEDSSDEEERAAASRPAPRQVVLVESSDEEEGGAGSENHGSNGSTGMGGGLGAAKPTLGRLVRKAELDKASSSGGGKVASSKGGSIDGDDLAAALGGLSIGRHGDSGSVSGSSTPAAQPSLRLPAVHVSRIREARRALESSDEEGDEAQCLRLGDEGQFKLSAQLSLKLYPHQVEGIKWLWRLHQTGTGGILADDMGLGKTMQCSAFLAGLLQCKLIRRALVIAPKTLLAHWAKELGVCGVGRLTQEYFGTENERARCLDCVFRHHGVLLTTYGMVLHNSDALAEWEEHDPDDGPLWDVMILDEGHKIKNPRMQLRKHLDAIPVQMRVIISGTPIQNNLQEMHTLFDFATPGLLGDARTFKDLYEKRITMGNDKHATQGERERGAVAAAQLRQTIAPYFLRREKKDVFSTNGGSEDKGSEGPAAGAAVPAGGSGAAKPASMGRKNDFIVWLRLKPMQRKVYEAFLNSDSVAAVFNQTNSALSALSVLKKICDHPALLSKHAEKGIVSGANRARRKQLGAGDSESDIESSSSGEDYHSSEDNGRRGKAAQQQGKQRAAQGPAAGVEEGGQWWDWTRGGANDQLLAEVHTTGFEASCKTVFVMELLHNLVPGGHRTLIFSQSRVMLNILEAAIKAEGWRFCRIDGSVASAQDREARVKQFQRSDTIPIFLLTSQVGGLGLTLTAADRVIIVDPAWNPSTDNQAVDRAYRIGQSRDVVVYRLISCGTVEEKIYRKQVYKGGLSRTGTEDGEQFRYFSQQELKDLFRLDPEEARRSATQQALHDMHTHQRRATPELQRHLAFLESLEGFAGVSDHDLLFSKKEVEGCGAVPFGSQPPEAGLGFGGGTQQRGAKPPSAIKKAAGQGWSGGGDISGIFARIMSLDGGSGASGSRAGCLGAATAAPAFGLPGTFQIKRDAKSTQQLKVEGLKEALRKQQLLLANPSIMATLPDGGNKVRAKEAELLRQLEAERAKLPGSAGEAGSSPICAVGPSTGSASSSSSSSSDVLLQAASPKAAAGGPAAKPAGLARPGGGAAAARGGWGSRAAGQPPGPGACAEAHLPATDASTANTVPNGREPVGMGTGAGVSVHGDGGNERGGGGGRAPPTQAPPQAPVSPLRAFGSKLLATVASAVLGSGQKAAPGPPPAAKPTLNAARGSSGRESEVIDLSLDDDDIDEQEETRSCAKRGEAAGSAAGADGPAAGLAKPAVKEGREQVPERPGDGGGDRERGQDAEGEEEAAGGVEAQRMAAKQLKKRLLKYATLLSLQEDEKVRHKVERLQAEYQAAKRKLKLMEATGVSLPAEEGD